MLSWNESDWSEVSSVSLVMRRREQHEQLQREIEWARDKRHVDEGGNAPTPLDFATYYLILACHNTLQHITAHCSKLQQYIILACRVVARDQTRLLFYRPCWGGGGGGGAGKSPHCNPAEYVAGGRGGWRGGVVGRRCE